MHINIAAGCFECPVPRQPRALDGRTLEYGDHFKRYEVAYVQADEDVYRDLDLSLGKDLEVEEEDSDFDDGKGPEVDKLVPKVQLSTCFSL